MDMPVITAARLKSYVCYRHLFARNGCEVTVTDEVLGVCCIRFADRENHLTLESGFGIFTGSIFRPYTFGEVERCPGLRPTCVETDMCDDFGDLGTGNTVLLRLLEVEHERIVRDTLTDKGGNRY